ncbi:hypothetical protein MKX01_007354 [Papaver californicum]|nr:hypothetical protein MKX01_007354 [Papaver californicum]
MVVVAPYASEGALSCGTVVSKMTPCLIYLQGGAIGSGCCPGVKSLLALAQVTPDRKAACNCLKSASGSILGTTPDSTVKAIECLKTQMRRILYCGQMRSNHKLMVKKLLY